MLRRVKSTNKSNIIEYADLLIDQNKKTLQVSDKNIKIGKTEYSILTLLMSRPENVFSREQIINHVWNNNLEVDDRTVDVHMSRLRKVLKDNYSGQCKIETVHGFGYCIKKS